MVSMCALVMNALKKFQSTLEARVALGCRLVLRLSCLVTSRVHP